MAEWQPIETAPKDGTKILAFNKWGEYGVAEWVESQQCWFAGYDDFTAPTHWMPLPEPPEDNSND